LIAGRPAASFLLVYLEDAQGGYSIDGEKLEAGEADLILLGPEHHLQPNGLRVDSGSVIAFSPACIDSRRPDEKSIVATGGARSPSRAGPWGQRVTVPHGERSLWASRIELLEWELENAGPGFRQVIRAHMTSLLIGALRLAAQAREETPADPVLREVYDVIDRDFRGQLSLDDVAREVGRSPRHLSRLVRQLTGATVLHLIDERRMEEARRLLLESAHTVETISDRVGYQDTGYFRKRFRRAHGNSPAEWRRENA
jgi:AraC-like DNA-binding protein